MNTFYGLEKVTNYRSYKLKPLNCGLLSIVKDLQFREVILEPKNSSQSLRDALFTTHGSFSTISSSVSTTLGTKLIAFSEFARYDQKIIAVFNALLPAVSTVTSLIAHSNSGSESEVMDKEMLSAILTILQNNAKAAMECSVLMVFKELGIESRSTKKVVGGNLDICVCESSNNRPRFNLRTNSQAVSVLCYCGPLGEAKRPNVALCSGTEQQLAGFSQPVIELCAMASYCTFPSRNIPLIMICGSRLKYRPLIYFSEDDLTLTTPRPIAYADSDGMAGIEGLFLMFLLCYKEALTYDLSRLSNCIKTGWSTALPSPNPYATTIVQEQCDNALNEPSQNLEPPLFMPSSSTLADALTALDDGVTPSVRKRTSDDTSTEGSKKPK